VRVDFNYSGVEAIKNNQKSDSIRIHSLPKRGGDASPKRIQWRKSLAYFAVFTLIVANVAMFTVGYRLTADDIFAHSLVLSDIENIFEHAWTGSVDAGRIGHLLLIPLSLVSSMFADNVFFRWFAAFWHFGIMLLFSKYASELTRRRITLPLFALMVSIHVLDFFHLPPNAYPLQISLPVTLIIVSRLGIIRLNSIGNHSPTKRIALSSMALIGVMFYELMVVFFFALVVTEIILKAQPANKLGGSNTLIRRLVSRHLYDIFVLLLYGSLYLSFRFVFPSNYDGNQVGSSFGLDVIVGHIFGGTIFSAIFRNIDLMVASVNSAGLLLVWAAFLVLLFTIIFLSYSFQTISRQANGELPSVTHFAMFTSGLLGAVLVTIPYSITARHQDWCGDFSTCVYLDSRVSFMFLSLAIFAVLLYFLDSGSASQAAFGSRILIPSLVVGVIGSITFVHNFAMAERMSKYVEPWERAQYIPCLDLTKYQGAPLKSFTNPHNALSLHPGFEEEQYWKLYIESLNSTNKNCPSIDEENLFSELQSYEAPLGQTVHLNKPGLPSFMVIATGLSFREDWGRWSDANLSPAVTFVFKEDLPREFTFEMTVIGFGPNSGKDMLVSVGSSNHKVRIPSDLQTILVNIEGPNTVNSISIMPPYPTSPAELLLGGDNREIGIGISSFRIIPTVNN
jgi:hypothetical protein